MKFKVTRTSDLSESSLEVEFSTLEDFIQWCKAQKNPIIVLAGEELEIYDDYRE